MFGTVVAIGYLSIDHHTELDEAPQRWHYGPHGRLRQSIGA
jgi:hypothetical protein